MNRNLRILVAGLLTTAVLLAPAVGVAQDKPKTPPPSKSETKPAPANRAIPFNGKVTAVDKAAMTVAVGERVFHLSSETKLMKGGQPATLADLKVGEAIAGNYHKGDDGKLTAKMIRIGPKPESAEKPAKSDKAEKKKSSTQSEKE